jgi:hypothetical protein
LHFVKRSCGEYFTQHGDVTIAVERLQIAGLCSSAKAFFYFNFSESLLFLCFVIPFYVIQSGINGRLLVVTHENSGNIHVVDVINRQTHDVINSSSDLGFLKSSLMLHEISPDDKYILFTDRKQPKGFRKNAKFISVVYDVRSSKSFDRCCKQQREIE